MINRVKSLNQPLGIMSSRSIILCLVGTFDIKIGRLAVSFVLVLIVAFGVLLLMEFLLNLNDGLYRQSF